MSSAATTSRRPRRILIAVSTIGLLLAVGGGITWWLSCPRGPLADHLRNRSWQVQTTATVAGKLDFHADGRLTQTIPQGQVHGEWSVADNQLTIRAMSRFTRVFSQLLGQSLPVTRYDVVEMTEDTVLLRMSGFNRPIEMKLTRIGE